MWVTSHCIRSLIDHPPLSEIFFFFFFFFFFFVVRSGCSKTGKWVRFEIVCQIFEDVRQYSGCDSGMLAVMPIKIQQSTTNSPAKREPTHKHDPPFLPNFFFLLPLSSFLKNQQQPWPRKDAICLFTCKLIKGKGGGESNASSVAFFAVFVDISVN